MKNAGFLSSWSLLALTLALSNPLSTAAQERLSSDAVRLARIVERQDVRVRQVRRRLDLGQEALGPDDCGEPENSRKLARCTTSRRFFDVWACC